MQPARYLLVFAATFAVAIAAAAGNAWLQTGMPTRNGYYTCSYIAAKIARGSAMPGPKLVIIGGSNTLAGIDTRKLAQDLSIHAFNFGLAASFGPGLQIFESEKILRPGDAALMPLEYMAYDYETPRNSLVDTVYSCGADFLASLPWRERLFFALAVKPQRIVDSLLFRLKPGAMQATATLAAHDVGPFGQRPDGNFTVQQVAIQAGLTNEPLDVRLRKESAGAAAIERFVAWARKNRVTVFATWPNTIVLPGNADEPGFHSIRDFYRGLHVDVVGTPEDAMLPASLMGDTFYHPNRQGMAVRTARLIETLRADPAFRTWQQMGIAALAPGR
jgi:hypothetical protein